MIKFNTTLMKFDKDYLNELTNQFNSGVFKIQSLYHIALHPAQLENFSESVKGEITKNVGRYDETLKGIMLGFEKGKLISKHGTIGVDNCYIHIDVEASFFVFRPQIDMQLQGVVTRASKDHVGCLVYNTFNISIPRPVVSNPNDSSWLGSQVSAQDKVEFIITFVDLTGRLPYIRGELCNVIKKVWTSTQETPNKKTKFLLDEEPQFSPIELKVKKEELNSSLESLDTKNLFSSTALDFTTSMPMIADAENNKVKKRRSKFEAQEMQVDEIALERDSDLEKIIGKKKGKKKNKSASIEV